jgi:hypothetical protein
MRLIDIINSQRVLSMRRIDDDPPGDGGGGGGGGDTGGGGTIEIQPGLGANLRRRYTCNLPITDEGPLIDVINEPILTTCRGYLVDNEKGQIGVRIKKPADYAFGTTAFMGDEIEVDNAQPWVDDQKYFIVIDPNTERSEVRSVISAVYPLSQNSIPLTSNEPAEVVVTGFAGADGASTPATATIDFGAFVATTDYTLTLSGTEIQFTPGSLDTGESIASTISGAINADPRLNRQFRSTWIDGDDFITLTARNGRLTLNAALTETHDAPQTDPTVAPTLATGGASDLALGEYIVAYAYQNSHGYTLLSPYKAITLVANRTIDVAGITPPAGCSVHWYVSPEAGSAKLRKYLENDGSAFTIDTPLPKLSASRPPDLNRTGTEIIRVCAVFSDREKIRSNIGRSNVMRGSFRWRPGGNRRKRINRIDFVYREAGQDYRQIELREQDDANIAKIKKANSEKVNGQGVDNYFQAKRLSTSMLAESLDADFYYNWGAIRAAGLLESGDVVCITDSGSGVVNLPVMVHDIDVNFNRASRPRYSFLAQRYYSTLYDDSVTDLAVPIVSELDTGGGVPAETNYLLFGGDRLVFNGDPLTFNP